MVYTPPLFTNPSDNSSIVKPLPFISNKQYPSIYIINNILYVYLFVNKNNIRSSIVTIKTRCSYLMKYKVDAREGIQEATSCKFYSKSLK